MQDTRPLPPAKKGGEEKERGVKEGESRERGRHDHAERGLALGGSEGVGAVSQAGGYRRHGVLGQ